ncbi:MAG: CPBP family intramembrane glutamic endopeptidase, partial [Bradymonadaceae bacterium]
RMKISSELRTFLLATFAICWSWAGLFYVLGVEYRGWAIFVIGPVFMLVPALVAFTIDKRAGKKVRESLRLNFRINRWWFVAWLIMPLLAFFSLVAAILLPGISFDADMGGFLAQLDVVLSEEEMAQAVEQLTRIPVGAFVALQLVQGLVAGLTINAVFGLGEELGWRGLMLRELAHTGFWKSAVIIGAFWGIWHAPLVLQGHNYPEAPITGVFVMTVWCILLSPVFSLITLRAGSVIAAGVMHGTLNATAAFSVLFLSDLIPFVTGIHGLVGMVLLVLLNLIIFFAFRPTLSDEDWQIPEPVGS